MHFVQDGAQINRALPDRARLETIFLVDGLGVGDKQNGFNKVNQSYFMLRHFVCLRQRGSKEGNVFLLHAMKAYRDSRGIAPLILKLDTRWR